MSTTLTMRDYLDVWPNQTITYRRCPQYCFRSTHSRRVFLLRQLMMLAELETTASKFDKLIAEFPG